MPNVREFLDDIEAVYRKHGLGLHVAPCWCGEVGPGLVVSELHEADVADLKKAETDLDTQRTA